MALTDLERLQAQSSPAGFAWVTSAREEVQPDGSSSIEHSWIPYEHLLLLNDRLMAAASGQLAAAGKKGLIVSMPPRHGKSELISKYTPAWFLGRYPDKKVILASYQAGFAATWGRKARDLLEEHGPEIFGVSVSQSSSAADHWEIEGRSGVMATAGAGGAITGKGAHLFVIDDPVKNAEEAASAVIREKHWDWWLSTARSRLQKGGFVVLVMTRWHEDDLAGRLLKAAEADPDADQWELLELPAIAFDDEPDALGREPGEPLCRELGFDEAWARATKASVGSYWWWALYQQRPRPAEGLLFKAHHFRYWEPHPDEPGLMILHRGPDQLTTQSLEHCALFRTVDVAASEKQTADYTVISTWAVTPERDLILVDRRRQRFEILDVGGFVKETHQSKALTSLPPGVWPGWDAPTALFVDVESFGHGLTVVQELIPQGLPIRRIEPHTDKVSRALVAVARYEEYKVFHPRTAAWLRELEDELLAFPGGKNDDQVDTVSMAALRLPDVSVGAPRSRREPRGRGRMSGVRDKTL